MFLLTATKKGFSAKETQRQLGLKRYEPVWVMAHKLRKAMGNRDDSNGFMRQIPSQIFGGVKPFVVKIPVGNPGGANTPPLKPFPIEKESPYRGKHSGMVLNSLNPDNYCYQFCSESFHFRITDARSLCFPY